MNWYKEVGGAATLAHQHGFPAFGPRVPASKPLLALPLPDGDGIIAAHDADRDDFGLLPWEGKPFHEKYVDLKKELQSQYRNAQDPLALTEVETAKLEEITKDISGLPSSAAWTEKGHDSLTEGMVANPAGVHMKKGFTWNAPTESLIKDIMASSSGHRQTSSDERLQLYRLYTLHCLPLLLDHNRNLVYCTD